MFEALAGVEFTIGAQGQSTIAEAPVLRVEVNPIGKLGSVGLRGLANHHAGDDPLALCGEQSGFKTKCGLSQTPLRTASFLGDPIGVHIALRARRNFLLGGRLLGYRLSATIADLSANLHRSLGSRGAVVVVMPPMQIEDF